MKANNFIRAVASFSFGAVAYFALTINGTSQASDDLQRKVEAHKVVLTASAPKTVKAVQKSSEEFVQAAPAPKAPRTPFSTPPKPRETRRATPPPKPTQDETLVETPDPAKVAADAREKKLEDQAKAQAKAAKIAKAKAIQKAKEIAEAKAKAKAEKERKEKEERERKEKEAAAARRERESLKNVPVPNRGYAAGFGDTGPWARYHTGVDYRASYGTTVRAVADGTITYAGNKGNWAGNHVVIRHKSGRKTLYAHLSSISQHSGHVEQGEKIGRVGQSGRAFGAHLHLELYPSGAHAGDVYSAVNPLPWLRNQGIR